MSQVSVGCQDSGAAKFERACRRAVAERLSAALRQCGSGRLGVEDQAHDDGIPQLAVAAAVLASPQALALESGALA